MAPMWLPTTCPRLLLMTPPTVGKLTTAAEVGPVGESSCSERQPERQAHGQRAVAQGVAPLARWPCPRVSGANAGLPYSPMVMVQVVPAIRARSGGSSSSLDPALAPAGPDAPRARSLDVEQQPLTAFQALIVNGAPLSTSPEYLIPAVEHHLGWFAGAMCLSLVSSK